MVTTFTTVLDARLRRDPGRPLITYYDAATGERVELSVTTYANWVAKTAGLLSDEHGLERGDTLLVDLPTHWLGTVFLGASWAVGLEVVGPDSPDEPDAVVCGPGGLARWAPRAGGVPVLACALLPLGVRFPEPLPAEVHDVGVEVWSQPDAFTSYDPPGPDSVAHRLSATALTQGALWEAASAGTLVKTGGRLLSTANPVSAPGLPALCEPLVKDGSLVLVTHAEREWLETTYVAEHATARFPA